MEAYAHQVLSTWSRHDSSAADGEQIRAQPGARSLLARSRQSQLTGAGSGMLRYEPTGYYIDGGDFTKFFQEAHANTNVTGEQTSTLNATAPSADPLAEATPQAMQQRICRGRLATAVTMAEAPTCRLGVLLSGALFAVAQRVGCIADEGQIAPEPPLISYDRAFRCAAFSQRQPAAAVSRTCAARRWRRQKGLGCWNQHSSYL